MHIVFECKVNSSLLRKNSAVRRKVEGIGKMKNPDQTYYQLIKELIQEENRLELSEKAHELKT